MKDPDRVTRNRLVRAQDEARATVYRGAMLIGVIPILLIAAVIAALAVGALVALVAGIFVAAYGLVGGIGGLAAIAAGITDHRKASRELRAFDEPRQLPMARIVER